ncbi:CHASE3 domain-containing protein [Cellulomonas sp. DKR-3]|uniref:histidine kinase n=1 Tax=Cellulomonas fulva TaxID=2835530 RepID=A0ABS5U354_9CELL|nr:sensor histidine kinase [Cellulomonas fulva]MBT0995814.1 CHASE3 domain-containing protein [Cellulomonas fulva]
MSAAAASREGGRPRAGSRTSLRHRLRQLLVGAGAFLVVLVALAGVAYAQQVQRQDIVTQDLFEAITRADAGYVTLVDAETSLRGYALTGDPAALEPYERAVAQGPEFEDIAQDVAQVRQDPTVDATAERADALAREWYEEYAAPLVAQIEADGIDSVDPAQIEEGKQRFDELRAAVTEFVDALRVLRDDVAHELTRWTRAASTVVGVLAVVMVTVGVLVWVALRRWVVEPLEQVGADVRGVASGDLAHPVLAQGPDEVRSLAHDVERMRTTLVEQVHAVEAARREVEDAHARLGEQAEELRRSNRDLEQFAYVASHDLQEPLRKVASFTQLLQKRYGGQLDERADQYIAFAVDGAKRMQRLIQDLLGFSRVGRVGRELTDVDLGAALDVATSQLEEAIADAGATVTHGELPTVVGEEPLLVQLFQNLVGNAVKFRDPERPARVHLSARRVPGAWELACEDDGIGIDEQYAERVFVIFQRLHAKDLYEGTGIGLALCKKIVEFHRGRIWIEQPTDGVGTRICWTLPDPVEDAAAATLTDGTTSTTIEPAASGGPTSAAGARDGAHA